MACQTGQRRLVVAPVFHELAGEFDRIPFDPVNPGAVCIVHLCQHVLQAMSHFVEQSFHFTKRHQTRCVSMWRRLIANQMSDRQLQLTVDDASTHAIVHPRSPPFVFRSRIRIEVERCDVSTRFVVDSVKADIGMPDADVCLLLNCHIEQATEQLEQATQHFLKREIRPQFVVGVSVALFAKPFCPESDVPDLKWRRITTCLLQRLEVFQVLDSRIPGGRSQVRKHLTHGRHTGSHFSGETDFCKIVIAQQVRLFLAKFQKPGDQGVVVQVSGRRTCDEGSIKLFAEAPVAAVLHKRSEQRQFKGNPPGSVRRSRLGPCVLMMRIPCFCCQVAQSPRPAFCVDRIRNFERKRFRGIKDMIREFRRQLR